MKMRFNAAMLVLAAGLLAAANAHGVTFTNIYLFSLFGDLLGVFHWAG